MKVVILEMFSGEDARCRRERGRDPLPPVAEHYPAIGILRVSSGIYPLGQLSLSLSKFVFFSFTVLIFFFALFLFSSHFVLV